MSRDFGTGVLEPAGVLNTCLDAIMRDNDEIGAVIELSPADSLAAAAAASERRWRDGSPLSPIDGAPILVKANIAVAGLPWHGGIAAYADRIAVRDAACVARLRASGVVVLGLTNMDEGALGARGRNAWLGPTRNPVRPDRTAGGSSSGSAAAVAAGFCAAALGSDTIGSIAIPASCCGVTGHRAATALFPTDDVMPLSPSLDRGGWITRDVAGSVLMLAAMGGVARLRPAVRLAALDVTDLSISPEAAEAFAETVSRLISAGMAVEPWRPPAPTANLGRQLFALAEIEGAMTHEIMLGARSGGFSPGLTRMLAWGLAHRGEHAARRASLRQTAEALAAALLGYDVLLSPTMPGFPALLDAPEAGDEALFTALPACLGWPATAIPVGSHDGLPLSILVTGRDDATCLAVAELLSRP